MTLPRHPFAPVHFSTDTLPEWRRLAAWHELYSRNIADVDIEPFGDEPFHASARFQSLAGVRLASGSRSAAHYHVTRRHIAEARQDVVKISVLTEGSSTVRQLGREIIGHPGAATVISGTEPSVSTMHCLSSFLTVVIPRQELAMLVPDLATAYGRQIAADNHALRMLIRYIDGMVGSEPLHTEGLAQAAARHIVELSALAVRATTDAGDRVRQPSVAAARLRTIKAHVLENLGNSGLSVAIVADRYGVSPRYVHKLFEREGSTFSEFLLTCRLERAVQLLKDPQLMMSTISTIAFECGFSDISHFNRTFRRAYHATPSDVRRRGDGQGS